jgi:predicted transcriptional regulator
MPPVETLSYAEASRELDVDQLVVQLERAAAIVDELDRRLRRTRAQVEELVPRLEAAGAGREEHGDEGEQRDDLRGVVP